jgi:signal peptidase II
LYRKLWTNSLFLLAVAILVILGDQGSKILVARRMTLGQSVAVLGDFFHLTFIRNTGGAFGIFIGGGWFYLVSSIVAVILIFYYLRRMSAGLVWSRVSLAVILGGALGNLIDRLRTGAVTDFLDFGIGRLRWPVFNVADAAVTVGVAIFLLTLLPKKKEDRGKDHEIHRSQTG